MKRSARFGIVLFLFALALPAAALAQDTDGDGMPDAYEAIYPCLNPAGNDAAVDYDVDSLTSLQEYSYSPSLNPCLADTDGDGVSDGMEVAFNSNPLLNFIVPRLFMVEPNQRQTSSVYDSSAPALAWHSPWYCLAYQDSQYSLGAPEILSLVFQPRGGGWFNRVTSAANASTNPSLSWGSVDFGLFWQDYRDGNDEIYFNRITTGGSKVLSDLRITGAASVSAFPSAAWTGSEFAVAWEEARDGNYEIYFARILANGTKVGGLDYRITNQSGASRHPALAWTGSEFGLAWYDSRSGGNDIYFVRVSPTGAVIPGEVNVSASANSDTDPVMTWTGSEFGIAWQDNALMEIYFARVAPTGSVVGTSLRATNASSTSAGPSLSWDGSEFAVAWHDNRSLNLEIYAALISPDGRKASNDFRVTSAANSSVQPAIVWAGSEFGVAWADLRDGASTEIYFSYLQLDRDGDGMNGSSETTAGTSAADWDSDNDGLDDGWEDGNTCMDPLTGDSLLDPDNDGLDNRGEYLNSSLPCDPDTDDDGLTDAYEVFVSLTEPNLADTDGDGLNDKWEVDFPCMDPLTGDSLLDYDTDTVSNQAEFAAGTNPCSSDSDSDSLPDPWEISRACLSAYTADSGLDPDNDGLSSLDEFNYNPAMDPCLADRDGDDLPDGHEVLLSLSDPFVADTDLDGFSDWEEDVIFHTDAVLADTDQDGDGLPDQVETDTGRCIASWDSGSDPLVPDTDGDGVSDLDEAVAGSCATDHRVKPHAERIGDEQRLTNNLSGTTNAAIVWTGSEYVAAHCDSRDGNPEIYLSRIAPNGVKIGGDTRVTFNTASSISPMFAWSGSEFGMAFIDSRDHSNFEGYFTRIDAAGAKIGSDLRLTYNAVYTTDFDIDWSGSEYGIAWSDDLLTASTNEIYFARVSAAGVKVGADLRLSNAAGVSRLPALAWTGSDFAVGWSDSRDGNSEIYFSRVSPAGSVLPAEKRLTFDPNGMGDLDLAGVNSRVVIAWPDARPGRTEIYFARLSPENIKLGDDDRLTYTSTNNKPRVVIAGGNAESGLAWEDDRDSANNEIYFAWVTAGGMKIGGDLRVSNSAASATYHPAIAWSGSEFGISYDDYRDGNYEVYFSRVALDIDGDGLLPDQEIAAGAEPRDWDTDHDRMSDGWEHGFSAACGLDPLAGDSAADPDLDLVPNLREYLAGASPCLTDSDADGVGDYDEINTYHTNPASPDTDGDLMPDRWEIDALGCGLDPLTGDSLADADGDALSNLREYQNSTLPCDPDSDNDLITDGEEINLLHTNPLEPDTDGDNIDDFDEVRNLRTNPLEDDTDGDGLDDFQEVMVYATNPTNVDMDDDGLTDAEEIAFGTDPRSIDSDRDGLPDFHEIKISLTNPLDVDSDHDGIPDGQETSLGLADRDSDLLPNAWENIFGCLHAGTADASADPDSDSLTNLQEFAAGTNPCEEDTDGDGLSDSAEVAGLTDPTSPDSDGDGLTDGVETDTGTYVGPTDTGSDPLVADSDGDAWSDGIEVDRGSDPNSPSSIPAGFSHLVNYQGRLANAGGAPVSGSVPMGFALFGVASGGTPLWSESQTVVVTNGIYNVLLGSMTPLVAEVFRQTEAIYLQVTVNGETLSPRTPLTSVPSAMFAERLYDGRLEMDTRNLSVSPAAATVTVHVSFRRAFAAPPKVMVGPLNGLIGGEMFVPGLVSNVTAAGFDVTFASLSAKAASGSASFTYQALGD